jgi:1,4-alpha-glucan branching enzyme
MSADFGASPCIEGDVVRFLLHDHDASEVCVVGSWDGWTQPGLRARAVEPGLWEARLTDLAPGEYRYKFRLGANRWLTDPANPARAHDGLGGWNATFVVVPRAY